MSLEARSLAFRYPRRGKKPVLEHVNRLIIWPQAGANRA